MNKLLSIEFSYGLNTYYALVRFKQIQNHREYFITILDGHLEEFVGKDIYLKEMDGQLVHEFDPSQESGKILNSISLAITRRLKEGSFDPQNINPLQA